MTKKIYTDHVEVDCLFYGIRYTYALLHLSLYCAYSERFLSKHELMFKCLYHG